MQTEKSGMTGWPINQGIILTVGLIVILATVKFAATLVIPFLLALSLSIILNPLIKYLTKKGIPAWIAILGLFVLASLPMIALGSYVATEVNELVANLDTLKEQFNNWLNSLSIWFSNIGISYSDEALQKLVNSSKLREIVHVVIVETGNQLSNVLMILILIIYMLLEAGDMQAKFHYAARFNPDLVKNLDELLARVKSYFIIKVQTSIITGLCIFILLMAFNIKYAMLWAVLAFFLNFIPIIGSIIAAIPPIILALITTSLATCLWVSGFFVLIEMVIGNFIEPKMMSKGLGLSAIVILLSMSFWGWMLGPTGMILSVPLTMCLQTFFSHYQQTRWISLMLQDDLEN